MNYIYKKNKLENIKKKFRSLVLALASNLNEVPTKIKYKYYILYKTTTKFKKGQKHITKLVKLKFAIVFEYYCSIY